MKMVALQKGESRFDGHVMRWRHWKRYVRGRYSRRMVKHLIAEYAFSESKGK